MNKLYDIDFSDYENQPFKPNNTNHNSDNKIYDMDFNDYESKDQSHPYFGQYAHLTASEYEKLSPEKKKELQEYSPLKGIAKGVAKGISLGASEYIPGLEIEEHETGSGLGEFIGEAAPIGLAFKAISYPLKAIPVVYKWTTRVAKTIGASLIGGGLEAGKEAISGEEINPVKVGLHAAMFGAFDTLIRSVPVAYQWFKNLKPKQQAEMLAEQVIPKDLPPASYKFYQNEVVPELQKVAEKEYQTAFQELVEKNNQEFQTKMQNVKAQHENDLYENARQKNLSEQDIIKAQEDYKNKIQQIAAEHETDLSNLEKENGQAIKDYEKQKLDFERTKSREKSVENALSHTQETSELDLQGRIQKGGIPLNKEIQYPKPSENLKELTGRIISPNKVTNSHAAGRNNMVAVRANDQADYRIVSELYNISESLNKSVQIEQPNLVNELVKTASEIGKIPDPSTPQKQLINTIQKIINQIAKFGENGEILELLPVNNHVLLEQAKALRYSMDFDFAHGGAKGIFKPTINQLQDAAETGAIFTGNEAAALANQEARGAYREWAKLYDNDYIRKYRDTSNHEFAKTFEGSLNVDDYIQLDKVLSRTNAGQQLSAGTRRRLVEKKLEPFYDNPRKVDTRKFEETLNELDPIITAEEKNLIRKEFDNARKTSGLQGRKTKKTEEPKLPKIKTIEKVNIPSYKVPKSKVKEITQVKIPIKPEAKPTSEMIAIGKKIKISTEETIKMTDTPTGIKNLKKELSKSETGKKLFNKVGHHKVRQILQEGKIQQKYTGEELYRVINKEENFNILSEILGEDAALDLLESSAAIGEKRMTVDALKKYAKKVGTVKAALIFGIL